MESDGSADPRKLKFLKKLSENFDKIAGGDGKLTVDDLKKDMEAHKAAHKAGHKKDNDSDDNGPQDPSTVTPEQLESPIDIKV